MIPRALNAEIPDGFNSVRIALPAGMKADLKWEKECAAAAAYVEKGYRIFWEMQLGLFNQLQYPLSSQMEFLLTPFFGTFLRNIGGAVSP